MIDLLHGDCLEIMPTLPAQSFDAIIADIPYGTTACSWDTVIPFAPMWEQLKRLAKARAAIVLFGSQPFTSALIASNFEMFKYCWTWDKVTGKGHLVAKIRPLQQTEDVAVFGQGKITYNPIKTKRNTPKEARECRRTEIMGGIRKLNYSRVTDFFYPKTLLRYSTERGLHPTQKPVALMEYLIRTYTNEGDKVLDFTMGSGTTMVAAVNTKRNGVGIELREDYYNIAQRRVQEAQQQMVLI